MPHSILIADDYDDNRELLRLILEMSGYSIIEARNGREAVEAARDNSFSVALIDLSMPVLDGYGALRELRADMKTQRLPCIALTAFAGEHDRQRAIGAGFDAFIAKPYQAQDLLQTIEHLIQNAHGTNEINGDGGSADNTPAYQLFANDTTNVTG